MMANDSIAAPPPAGKAPKTWRRGTLVYTAGGLMVLFFWLLWGDFAWNIKDRAIYPVAQMLLKQYGARDMLVGLLLGSIPMGLAMIMGPVISVHSDRHRGRWGRRIPYLLIPTPFAAVSMMMIAFSPPLGQHLHAFLGANSPGANACVLIVFSLFWSLFEVATTVANTILGGLINDVVPEEIIGRFFGLFRAVSLFAGIVFNFWLLGKAEMHYVAIFVVIAAFYGLGFSMMCFRVKEGEYPPVESLPVTKHGGKIGSGFKAYIRECYANPYYRWIFVAMTFAALAGNPINSFSLFYARPAR